MALSPKLHLRQTQSLVMTPQLLQSIRLLQLGQAELDRFIAEEIERNPLLERQDPAEEALKDAEAAGNLDESGYSAQAIAEQLDTSLENVFPDDPGRWDPIGPDLSAQWRSVRGIGNVGAAAVDGWTPEMSAAAPVTLRDHLQDQIAIACLEAAMRPLVDELVGELDDAGYFIGSIEEIAERTGAGQAMVRRALQIC